MKHLIIDGANFAWRCRVWDETSPVPFLFFRNLRALVEAHSPDAVWYVLEGHPAARYEALPEYKANRRLEDDDPKALERAAFLEEVTLARKVMSLCLPVRTVRHPNWECDDTAANLVRKIVEMSHGSKPEVVLSSTDTDFIQLLDEHPELRLWNHTKKEFVERPSYDYVAWKALKGDGSDNIAGFPGIGEKRAAKLVLDHVLLENFLAAPGARELFERNRELIRFHRFTPEEMSSLEVTSGSLDPSSIFEFFVAIGARSLIAERYWDRFIATFEKLR